MPTGLFITPGKQTFVALDGSPLSGGTVAYYIPGGDTPKSTFQDISLTIPNTNPVVLDERGQASIWGGGSYREVLEDADGNLIWDVVTQVGADAPATVDSIATLRLLGPLPSNAVNVLGYYSPGDGGGGFFFIKEGDTAADNGGTIIVDANGRRWYRELQGWLSPVMFGAMGNATGVTGVGNDDTAELQACINVCASSNTPGLWESRTFRTTAPLTVPAEISFGGRAPPGIPAILPQPQIYTGTWLFADHTGVALSHVNGAGPTQLVGSVSIYNLAIKRNQPFPGTGWTPTANDFDMEFINSSYIFLTDIFFNSSTNGAKFLNTSQAQLQNIRGQIFQTGFHVEDSFDVFRFDQFHIWPYWAQVPAVMNYQAINNNIFQIGRCDNPIFSNIFVFGAANGIQIIGTTNGTLNQGQFTNMDFDSCARAIFVDTSSSGTVFNGCNLIANGNAASTDGVAVFVVGSNAIIDITNLEVLSFLDSAIQVSTGTNNLVRITGLQVNAYDQAHLGAPAVFSQGTTNTIEVIGLPVINSGGGTGPKYGGTGLVKVDDWRNYTPTVTASTGAITTLGTVTGKYKIVSDTVSVQHFITITTNGSAAGGVIASNPFGVPSVIFAGVGADTGATGKQLKILAPSGSPNVVYNNYDNTYPGYDGAQIVGNYNYSI